MSAAIACGEKTMLTQGPYHPEAYRPVSLTHPTHASRQGLKSPHPPPLLHEASCGLEPQPAQGPPGPAAKRRAPRLSSGCRAPGPFCNRFVPGFTRASSLGRSATGLYPGFVGGSASHPCLPGQDWGGRSETGFPSCHLDLDRAGLIPLCIRLSF